MGTRELSKEEMHFPDFNLKDVEALYQHDLTLPDEVYESLLQKDRKLLIEDLEKLLKHAVDQFKIFDDDEILVRHTFFVWHALFLLRDIEAHEALPAFIDFLKQDEELVQLYLGDGMVNFGWEVFFQLGNHNLRPLVDFAKNLGDDFTYRVEIVEALKQIAIHHPEKKLEIEAYLRELLLYAASITMMEDGFIDEVADKVLEAIGNVNLTRLFPEVEKLLNEGALPTMFIEDFEDFESQYVGSDKGKELVRTRKEIYFEYLEAQNEKDDDDDDDDNDDEDLYNDFEDYLDELDKNDAYEDSLEELENEDILENNKTYLDYTEINTPFVKKEPDVGRNEPCPCGSGKKYKKCHGKS